MPLSTLTPENLMKLLQSPYHWICHVQIRWIKHYWRVPREVPINSFTTSLRRQSRFIAKPLEPSREGKGAWSCYKCPDNSIHKGTTSHEQYEWFYASSNSYQITGEDEEEVSPQKRQRVDGYPVGPSTCSYWPKSPEAYQLFKPRREYVSVYDSAQNLTTTPIEFIETPQEALERRIFQLRPKSKKFGRGRYFWH